MAPRALSIFTALAIAGCSLLAPTDDEASRGLSADSGSDGATRAQEAGADAAAGPSVDAASDGPGARRCPGCALACNEGECAACYHNGGPCNRDEDCCSGAGSCVDETCGPAAGSCRARGESCATAATSCCGGHTCSSESGARCERCAAPAANCGADEDCCSLNCESGACGACLGPGIGCARARQCCSGICSAGTCT